MISQTLPKLRFKCQVKECSQVYEQAGAQEHKMRHHPFDCPFGCGVKIIGKAALEQHLLTPECPNVPVHCKDCDTDTFLQL
jgi:hypothetical protein